MPRGRETSASPDCSPTGASSPVTRGRSGSRSPAATCSAAANGERAAGRAQPDRRRLTRRIPPDPCH